MKKLISILILLHIVSIPFIIRDLVEYNNYSHPIKGIVLEVHPYIMKVELKEQGHYNQVIERPISEFLFQRLSKGDEVTLLLSQKELDLQATLPNKNIYLILIITSTLVLTLILIIINHRIESPSILIHQ
jgi:hypothetical protein